MLRATATLPYDRPEQATAGLRGRLRLMAVGENRIPDWTTLEVVGPMTSTDRLGRTWFEWTATVQSAM